MPAMTSVEVAICGTHFGDTKDAASMLGKPAAVSLSTSAILTAAGMVSFSFCKPSRGPTSTILTFFGKAGSAISVSFRRVDHAGDRLAAFQPGDLAGDLAH